MTINPVLNIDVVCTDIASSAAHQRHAMRQIKRTQHTTDQSKTCACFLAWWKRQWVKASTLHVKLLLSFYKKKY